MMRLLGGDGKEPAEAAREQSLEGIAGQGPAGQEAPGRPQEAPQRPEGRAHVIPAGYGPGRHQEAAQIRPAAHPKRSRRSRPPSTSGSGHPTSRPAPPRSSWSTRSMARSATRLNSETMCRGPVQPGACAPASTAHTLTARTADADTPASCAGRAHPRQSNHQIRILLDPRTASSGPGMGGNNSDREEYARRHRLAPGDQSGVGTVMISTVGRARPTTPSRPYHPTCRRPGTLPATAEAERCCFTASRPLLGDGPDAPSQTL